jgi:hypothetical protein
MLRYTCFFLGPDNHLSARREFEAHSTRDAIVSARVFATAHAEAPLRTVEVWEGCRLVWTEDYPFETGIEPNAA